jgi:inner membrane protein YidH
VKKHHYRSFERHELILRDWLALDRTVLANERTFLAFSRTGLTLIIAGLAFVKFFGHIVYIAFGYVFIVSGICVFIFGVVRYRRMVANLKVVKQAEDDMLQQPLEQAMLETADELHAMKRTEKRTRGTA